jgi:hypothetical protein
MKKKIILTIGLLFALVKGYAQVKIGSNATTITSNKYLEVEATNGKKVNINKDDGRVFIENKPSASLTDSVVMRYSDGEIRQISMSRLGGALSGYQDSDGDGIPNNTDTDDDNDGILDGADKCPIVYGCAGTSTTNGCPSNCGSANTDSSSLYFKPSSGGGNINSCMISYMNTGNTLGEFNTYLYKKPNNKARVGAELDIAGDYVIATAGATGGMSNSSATETNQGPGTSDTVFVYKGLKTLYKITTTTTSTYARFCAINATNFFVSGYGTNSDFVDIYSLADGQVSGIKTFGAPSIERIQGMDASPKGPYLVVVTQTYNVVNSVQVWTYKAYLYKRTSTLTYNKVGEVIVVGDSNTGGNTQGLGISVQINDAGDFVIGAYGGKKLQAFSNSNDVWTEKLYRTIVNGVGQIGIDNIGFSYGVSYENWINNGTVSYDSVYYYTKDITMGNFTKSASILINEDITNPNYSSPSFTAAARKSWFFNPWGNGQGDATRSWVSTLQTSMGGRSRGNLLLSNCYVIFNHGESGWASFYKWNVARSSLTPVGGFLARNNVNYFKQSVSVDMNTNIVVFGCNTGQTSSVSAMYIGCDGGCN